MIVEILIAIAILVVPYILFNGLYRTYIELRSKRLIEDALMYGVYDSIWASRKKYKVEKGMYDEYILKSTDGTDSFVMSKLHLWNCLKRERNKLPNWTIAYDWSKPAEIKINSRTRVNE